MIYHTRLSLYAIKYLQYKGILISLTRTFTFCWKSIGQQIVKKVCEYKVHVTDTFSKFPWKMWVKVKLRCCVERTWFFRCLKRNEIKTFKIKCEVWYFIARNIFIVKTIIEYYDIWFRAKQLNTLWFYLSRYSCFVFVTILARQ